MPNCDHVGPEQVVEYAEHALRERGLQPEKWDGARYAWAGNVERRLARDAGGATEERDSGERERVSDALTK